MVNKKNALNLVYVNFFLRNAFHDTFIKILKISRTVVWMTLQLVVVNQNPCRNEIFKQVDWRAYMKGLFVKMGHILGKPT